MDERIFALDIGTRSVTGILLEKQHDRFSVIDFYTKEHQERSMRDGQIHNVVAVANVIKEVKEKLENKHGKLRSVCVAAAGRALKTIQASASIDLNEQPIVEDDMIKHLELSAVQTAQTQLASTESNSDNINYYCVGYSVLYYKLDNETIGSLIDQNGQQASVDIIATFLPKVVVESLLAALARADLEMEALTLEPIAAIHVLIPESMRRLNVALVDIGAGTSDIALTDKGTVIAYGMVPVAGDEITEAISDQYLLDFPKAEEAKRMIVNNGEYIAQDILGFETKLTYDILAEDLSANVEKLADAIAEEIIRLNSTPPKAVMLIGGGSLTPEITTILARKLQLPANRVAVRGIEAIQNLKETASLPSGPDYITPIGIAIAAKQNPVHYVSVKVNEKTIRMFEMKQLSVGDCLIQAGIEINKWYGKPGMAKFVMVNEKELTIPGEFGKPPVIQLNNQQVSVDHIIHDGDEIMIERGLNGKEIPITLTELVGETPTFTIYFNDEHYQIGTTYIVNNQPKEKDYIIQDKDNISLKHIRTAQDFIDSVLPGKGISITPFRVFVNNESIPIDDEHACLYINEKVANVNHPLMNGDRLNMKPQKAKTLKDVLDSCNEQYWETIDVSFNQQPVAIKQQCIDVLRGHEQLTEESIIKPNDRIHITKRECAPFIFQDVFRYVDIDLTGIRGNFKLYKNQQSTSFHESIQHGDKLKIEWN